MTYITAKQEKTYIYGYEGRARTEDEYILKFKHAAQEQTVQLDFNEITELYFKLQKLINKRIK